MECVEVERSEIEGSGSRFRHSTAEGGDVGETGVVVYECHGDVATHGLWGKEESREGSGGRGGSGKEVVRRRRGERVVNWTYASNK